MEIAIQKVLKFSTIILAEKFFLNFPENALIWQEHQINRPSRQLHFQSEQ